MSEFFDEYGPMLVGYALQVVGVAVVFFVAWLFAGWARRIVRRSLIKAKIEQTIAKFISNVVRWVILAAAILGCLGYFGIETTSFAALIGAAGLAIGLSFQGALSNLAAGVMLLIFRPFKVSDVVKIQGELGKVDEIDLFVTSLDTFDNRRLILPNSQVFGAKIENLSHHAQRRVDVDVGVSYGASMQETRKVLTQAITKVDNVLESPESQVLLTNLGDSSVQWQVRVWVESANFHPVREALVGAIKSSLDEAGIEIPFPQMSVHLPKA